MKFKISLPGYSLEWFKSNWRQIIYVSLVLAIVALVLTPQPAVIENKANIYEAQTLLKLQEPDKPWYRAVNAVYLLPSLALGKITGNNLEAARLVSTIMVAGATILFYFLIKAWFNQRLAMVASALLLTNSLMLNFAHQAVSWAAINLSLIAIFFSLNWFLRTKKLVFLSFLSFISILALSAYLPYGLWFILVGIIGLILYGRKNLKKLKSWQLIVSAVVYLLILLPLFMSLLGAPGQLRELLGVPAQVASVSQYGLNVGLIISSIFVYSVRLQPILFLGNLPLLDIFTAALVLTGVYYFVKRLRHRRSLLLFSSSAILVIILALRENFLIFLGILLPLIYAFAVAGLVELMRRWFSYFPRNPLVRNFGVLMLVIAIALTSFYQMERYFVAWARSPETKSVYMIEYKQ